VEAAIRAAVPGGALDARFADVRARTRALAAPLSAEDCVVQSMPDASPVKWHLAHTSWFFETFVLERFVAGYAAFAPQFRVLFNSYYQGVGERHPRPERGLLTRPSLDDILAYRAHVDGAVAPLLERPGANADLTALLELGLQHEQQHQELILTDVLHLLSCNPMAPAYRTPESPRPAVVAPRRWLPFAGGLVDIGHAGSGFAFDNETPRHRAFVAPFAIASHPVTQGEFLAFVEDGGYRRPELWLALGWDTRTARGWDLPCHWRRQDGRWTTFTLRGRVPLDPQAPMAHASYFEADAYARWARARLPTEFEWEVAAAGVPVEGNFLDDGVLQPLPPAHLPGDDAPAQLFGDVWEWTASVYAPYPGFRVAPGAVGEYNGKFMCNQYVLRGGSCATPRSHVRPTYRNFFPPEARWQFSGLRLARDAA